MQDAAEAVGRNNDQRKVLVCVTWEKLVPSPFFNSVLWLSSAGHEFGFCESFHPWSTPGCGGDGWEPLLSSSSHAPKAVCSSLWVRGQVGTSRSSSGEVLKGEFPLG